MITVQRGSGSFAATVKSQRIRDTSKKWLKSIWNKNLYGKKSLFFTLTKKILEFLVDI